MRFAAVWPFCAGTSFSWPAVQSTPAVAEAFVRELATEGFVYVEDHGVPADLLAAALASGERFFAEPLATKSGFLTPPGRNLKCGRGYIPAFGEQLDAHGGPDPKEVLDLGLPATADQERHLGATRWPADVENATKALAAPVRLLSRQVLAAVEAVLGVRFTAFDPPMLLARHTHYLPSSGLGCGSHFDFGGLTWIVQSSPGLEVRRSVGAEEAAPTTFMPDLEHSYGAFVPVPPVPGTLVLQAGEALQRLTAGHVPASRHRVVGTGADRYSLSFFVDPDPAATLAPPPELEPAGPAYAPMLAGHKGVVLLGSLSRLV